MRKHLLTAAVLLLPTASLAAPETGAAWECKFTQRTVCTATGCSAGNGRTWIYLTPSQESYWRCEGTGFDDCDQYKATVANSGAYKVFEIPGRTAFAKVGPTLEVTEVLSLMDGVWINRGQCIVGPPPLIRVH
jgi:hypothetical protein